MADLSGFNAANIEPARDFELLPAGDYKCVITETERKATKAGTGSYLEMRLEVIDGPSKGRLLFERLNLWNPNEVAVKIAQQQLAALCRALGIITPEDSSEFLNKPVCATVKIDKGRDGYNDSNGIKTYKAVADCKTATAAAPTAAPTATAPWDV